MAEYIEREAAKKVLAFGVGVTAANALDKIPAADVVEVVRCRDCKHTGDPTGRGNFLCGRKMLGLVRPDDFCSFGERMDGE